MKRDLIGIEKNIQVIRKVLREIGEGLVILVSMLLIFVPCVIFVGMLKISDKIFGEEDLVNS